MTALIAFLLFRASALGSSVPLLSGQLAESSRSVQELSEGGSHAGADATQEARSSESQREQHHGDQERSIPGTQQGKTSWDTLKALKYSLCFFLSALFR